MMEDLVWQPENVYQPSYGFKIKLDAGFARDVLEVSVPQEYQENLNDFSEDILDELNFSYPSPLNFYDDTFFATGLHLGNNGIWLSTEAPGKLRHEDEFVEYYSHNVDTGSEAYALMALFDNWSDKAAVLLEK